MELGKKNARLVVFILTDNGVIKAVSLGERLKKTKLAAIFSSPSGRTMATTNLIRGDRENGV